MDALEYLRERRDRYVESYRAVIRAKRAEGIIGTPEVWVQPNVRPGEQGPPHPLCIDIMTQTSGKPEMVMVAGEEPAEGVRIGSLRARDLDVKLYPVYWEVFPVWVRHPDPDWSSLEPWCRKWMDVNGRDHSDEDGLTGVVHYIGRPIAEGGGFVYVMDFGSAPVEAVLELIDALASMGATAIELGRSDGSDLPKEVLTALKQRELSMDQLAALAIQVIQELDEVERVERVSSEELAVYEGGDKHARRVFLGNLYRLLLRTGVEARPKEILRFIRGHRESAMVDKIPDLLQLRPVIKDDRFFAEIKRRAPQMKQLVARQLVADLWVVGVWDAPNGMRFATNDEPEKFGLSSEQVLNRAHKNYLADPRKIELSNDGLLLVAQTRDCYDATLLLNDDWLNQIASKVDGELLACVPARHVVLIGGTGKAGTLEEMRRAAQRIEKGGDHLISGTILVRRGNAWQEFEREEPVATPEVPKLPAQSPTQSPQSAKRKWWRFR